MSVSISIIVGFRNREFERVAQFINSLATQNQKNFELIFVDYGSNLDLAERIEQYLNEWEFCKYLYHDSRGKPWSRSHALNIGALASKGNYLYFTDIDLLFHPDYLQHLTGLMSKDIQLYTRVYYLPEGFKDFQLLYQEAIYKQCEISHTSGKGILFVNKITFLQIRGYDEFYCDWGIEDNDIFIRLKNNGLMEDWADHEKYPVYHVWHPPANSGINFPDKWLDESSYYYIRNTTAIKRNHRSFGLLTKKEDREITKRIETNQIDSDLVLPENGTFPTRTFVYRTLWSEVENKRDTLVKIQFTRFHLSQLSVINRFINRTLNWGLYLIKSPFQLVYTPEAERAESYFPERDILWFLRKMEKDENLNFDYYLEIRDNTYTLYIYSFI
jgi:glycosyltransferase involved in cell wall biosynthesis